MITIPYHNKSTIATVFLILLALLSCSVFASVQEASTSLSYTVCGNNIKETGEQCDGYDLGSVSCLNLGYSGGTLGCSAACELQTTSCISTAPIVSTTSTIDLSDGGTATLTNPDNTIVVFTFPANSYTEDIKLQANSYANNFFTSDKPTPSGKSFIGETYDFSLITALSEKQVPITSAAVSVTINYSDSDISGIDENTLAPYRWGANDTSWQLISGATLDTINNKITFSTTQFSAFALFGSPQQQGGGGGGGGGVYVPPQPQTMVNFSGRAYPLSKVVVLKDGQIAISTIAGSDARFEISLTGLATGDYIFAVYGEDNKGIRSSLFTFPVYITSGATTKVSGIFISPTIAVDKSEVKRGDNIAIFGQSVPNGEITISVNSDEKLFNKIKADASGAYLYNFDTSLIDTGQHLTKSKAALDGEISTFSKAIGFLVGTKNILAQLPTKTPLKGDSNNDSRVNLVDFSIAAYWYKRASPPVSVDLNKDGKVDLVDFSIMAYYWTG
jgi:hypothetical protein